MSKAIPLLVLKISLYYSSMYYNEYIWLIVIGSLGAFGFGWGTGSNDVANAFGTSIGSKTLTLKQAVILASIFEFTGALALGRVSIETIAGGITDVTVFKSNPPVYAYGMCCVLLMGFAWQAFASYKGWNVSATHSIIGGIIGFALAYEGGDAVNWATKDGSGKSFPPYKGVVPIVLAWFISPVLTGLASSFIFWLTRTFILRSANPYIRSFYAIPILVLITTWINIYFIFTKGAKKMLESKNEWSDAKSAWITTIIATGLSGLSAISTPFLKRYIDKPPKEHRSDTDVALTVQKQRSITDIILTGVNVDIHADIDKNQVIADIHNNAEVFDIKAEHVFKYLQVFSAICVIFAHGAGEVGYMAGPLGVIWTIVKDGTIVKKLVAPIWVIVIGATGLVVGLATYGYNVSRTMGVEMAKLTATRGFAAELATALVILLASQYGLPTSSSQCITGGIVGVGLLEGRKGVNWSLFGKIFLSWIATMFVMGVGTAAVFSQGIYAPCTTK